MKEQISEKNSIAFVFFGGKGAFSNVNSEWCTGVEGNLSTGLQHGIQVFSHKTKSYGSKM